MNTLTSVVLLSLLVSFSQGNEQVVTLSLGDNYTLVGPQDIPVTWYGGKGINKLCEGNNVHFKQLKHNCNEQNLTLIDVNKTYEAKYYGYRHDNTGKKDFRIVVITPTPKSKTPKTHKVFIRNGQNYTLTGPEYTPVQWFGGKNIVMLCDGSTVHHKELKHRCNKQNITLIKVNQTFEGHYYGYSNDNTYMEHYDVVVLNSDSKNQAQRKIIVTKKPDNGVVTPIQVTIKPGTNFTLVGPTDIPIIWYDNGLEDPCKDKYRLRVECNEQNLTLINVNKTYETSFYGYGDKNHAKRYRVKVNTTNSKTVKIQHYTRQPTTAITNHKQNFELQVDDSNENNKIPSTTVAIVVGVIAGFITLIIVILCYICCRKRPRTYNHMVDPLLSFSY